MAAPAVDPDLLTRGGLLLDVAGERATITMHRPESLNAMRPSTWEALREIGARLSPDVRVVLVRGSGSSFCAGLDRAMFSPAGIDGEPGFADIIAAGPAGADTIGRWQEGLSWLMAPDRVTVAAVQGHAIGGGFQLALACDIRIATPDARFAMAETSLGIVPDLAGTLPLVRAVGYSRAAEICLTGRRVGAQEALRIGLVNSVVEPAELDAAVEDLITALLRPLPGATRETLALLDAAAQAPALDDQRLAERTAQLRRLADLHRLLSGG